MRKSAYSMALGGVLAALAVVIMSMGTLIPGATYVCPLLCMLLLRQVHRVCGSRLAWAWYAAVAILSALMAPDKEAAAVFVFLGYYPIIKPWLDRRRLKWLLKAAYFNGVTIAMYALLIHLLGMAELARELSELGTVMLAATLILGNLTFFLLDLVLGRGLRLWKR